MGIILSHSHFVHVAFVAILVFQTFDRMIFGIKSFHERRCYAVIARDPQMVSDQKKFRNYSFRLTFKTLFFDTIHEAMLFVQNMARTITAESIYAYISPAALK